MPEYRVREGDCIASIAHKYGLFWEKIWNAAENADLKEQRKNHNILEPGDIVFISEFEKREEAGATETKHRFRLKGVPVKCRLRLVRRPEDEPVEPEPIDPAQYPLPRDSETSDPEPPSTQQEDEPRANTRYQVKIEGQIIAGQTDDDGILEFNVPPGAQTGKLIIEPGSNEEEIIILKLGHLNPLNQISGVKQRLKNLGFDCGDTSEEMTDGLVAALRGFQEKHSLEVTGELDDATRQKIEEIHGD